ncbi:DnaD domain protein [Dorea sp. AM13-35]|uniref:DnaD domain protein n=1 Tax=Dorea sp. AM13-35 TaxID=2293099 RepID=UPI000E47320B|nr:DnaD domain protein [Dorea sp. AM13-35]RHO41215.1 DnaD domain protein [Dorea sp. AM13-35]
MKTLTLTNQAKKTVTVLENEFIDRYMPKANGEYVKVYLMLLRHLDESASLPAPSRLADLLECTEKDILRAFKYWEGQGLLEYKEEAPDRSLQAEVSPSEASLTVAPVSCTDKSVNTRKHGNRKEFKELLFVAEQYLGKTLSATDINAITYFYETLQMSADLIEYLIEYCVENGHKSIHYIQKVALSWHSQDIRTAEQAKTNSVLYNKNCYSILNAYGIKGRAPAASEIAYIRKWHEEYAFSLEIILEACDRTMNMIHQPNFEYTDSILKNWYKKNVHTLEDVSVLDAAFTRAKADKARQQTTQPSKPSGRNKFNNFENRSYDMNDLERRLIQQ